MSRERLLNLPPEKRSFEEEMAELGVTIERPNAIKIKNVVWCGPRKGQKRAQHDRIGLNRACIVIGKNIFGKLNNCERVKFGVGEIVNKGQAAKCLVMVPVADKKTGHKLTRSDFGSAYVNSKNLVARLLSDGLKIGYYAYQCNVRGGGIVAVLTREKGNKNREAKP